MTKISGECSGVDGGKKVKGRKRHIATDTQGMLLALKVHAANEHDSRSGWKVLEQLKGRYGRMKKIYADGGYRGELVDKVKVILNCELTNLRISNRYLSGGLLSGVLLGLMISADWQRITNERLIVPKI